MANVKDTLVASYYHLVKRGAIEVDPYQEKILESLVRLKKHIHRAEKYCNQHFLKKIFSAGKPRHNSRGIYIYGPVGRGKSMLMDLFFASLKIRKKRRVHFHGFMLEVHERMKTWRENNKSDPIPPIAKQIAAESRVLCFDEFQVHDIADAMILGRLFSALFDEGVIVVATSNRMPDGLYKNGLQRDQFVPFINLMKESMEILLLDGGQDYRLAHIRSLSTTYYIPLGPDADAFMEKTFMELSHNASPQSCVLNVGGRKLPVSKMYGDIAQFTFAELCERPLGAADYIEIAREFTTIFLANIPKMTRENRNEARRFVTLIDELYEHKTSLICTAEVPPQELYTEGDGNFEFGRTISRLTEMQSEEYIGREHVG